MKHLNAGLHVLAEQAPWAPTVVGLLRVAEHGVMREGVGPSVGSILREQKRMLVLVVVHVWPGAGVLVATLPRCMTALDRRIVADVRIRRDRWQAGQQRRRDQVYGCEVH